MGGRGLDQRTPRREARPNRLRALARGRASEFVAAAFLLAHGHRILARRYKTPVGEIDLIVRKGNRVAFVEVKHRPSRQNCEAAITGETRRRVRRAADSWMARHDKYRACDLAFDLVFIVPGRWPEHLRDAL